MNQLSLIHILSDFAGHGRSLIDFEQGYFGEHDGPMHLIEDMHHLQMIIREKYPDSPYFMLGVDLGSILIRKYMTVFGDFIEGALLLGTPSKVDFFYLKRIYLRLLKMWKGPLHKAPVSYTHLDVYKRQAFMSGRL